jgi:hypothetical protein
LFEAIRKTVRETKVKCEDEPGSWVNYFQKLLKNDVPETLGDRTLNNANWIDTLNSCRNYIYFN